MTLYTVIGDPATEKFKCPHTFDPNRSIMLCQDFSHNVKKLRNAVFSSGTSGHHTRYLVKSGHPIVWKQWVDCIEWDRATNSRLIHHKVTESHLHPNSAEKMRNKLAEDMMGEDMLNVMLKYQVSTFIAKIWANNNRALFSVYIIYINVDMINSRTVCRMAPTLLVLLTCSHRQAA